MVDSFCYVEPPLQAQYRFLSCDNLLILLITHVSCFANIRSGAKIRGRELCNENILR